MRLSSPGGSLRLIRFLVVSIMVSNVICAECNNESGNATNEKQWMLDFWDVCEIFSYRGNRNYNVASRISENSNVRYGTYTNFCINNWFVNGVSWNDDFVTRNNCEWTNNCAHWYQMALQTNGLSGYGFGLRHEGGIIHKAFYDASDNGMSGIKDQYGCGGIVHQDPVSFYDACECPNGSLCCFKITLTCFQIPSLIRSFWCFSTDVVSDMCGNFGNLFTMFSETENGFTVGTSATMLPKICRVSTNVLSVS